jgi:tetratricopeptide (TPR) repeat protein
LSIKLDPILTKAARLSKRRQYGTAIQILEPEVVRYHDSFRYYYILASSCLYLGDFSGAFTYFKRARDIKMRDPSVLLGMAILYLRRGDTARAIDFYLEVQELDPANVQARRALSFIKKHGDPENLEAWIESGKLSKLYPPLPKVPLTAVDIIIPAAGLLLILALCLGIFYKVKNPSAPKRSGFDLANLEREDRAEPVQVGGSYRYVLTRQQVLDIYEKALDLFTDRRDEASKVELNRLLESNASESIKNKARILISYTELPGFDTLEDRYSYADVAREPWLYRNCYVIWRGMAANVFMPEKGTSFQLLVGYDTRSALEGIVPVEFDISIPVDLERPLEILGKVVPANSNDGQGMSLILEGIAIHQAANLGANR